MSTRAHQVPGPSVTPAAPYGPSAARVLGLLRLAGHQGASRSELAAGTGLTHQAISKIIPRLRADGLVKEAGRRASTGGKPSTVLRLAPGARHAVGLQLDRDQLTAVLVDLSGTRIAERTTALDFGGGAEAVLGPAESAVRELIAAGLPGTAPPLDSAEARRAAGEGEVWTGGGAGAGADSGAGMGERPADGHASGRSTNEEAAVEGELWRGAAGRRLPDAAGAFEDVPVDASGDSPVDAPGAAAGETAGAAGAGREEEAGQARPRPVARSASWGKVLGLGVAAPGPLDHERGVLLRVPGYEQWDGYPLRDALARRLGLPVVLDKDTDAAAVGLALHGTGSGSFAYLHLGTGLGMGLVLQGRVHRGGGRPGAGEFGHQVLRLDGPLCRCGRRGCAEVLCLGAVEGGDVAEAARVLGVGAANLVSLLGIDRVVLGGRTVLADPGAYVDGVSAAIDELQRPGAHGAGEGGGEGAGAGAGASGGAGAGAGAGLGGGAGVDVGVEVAPAGPWMVADGAAQLVLAPLFGRSSDALRPS
jgi:predicted NBD/HSP70 family sugar kinase